jgi:hypothetical protein
MDESRIKTLIPAPARKIDRYDHFNTKSETESYLGKRCACLDSSSGMDLLGTSRLDSPGVIRSKFRPSTRKITTWKKEMIDKCEVNGG